MYFNSILPTKLFQPGKKSTAPIDEQIDGLLRLLDDVDRNRKDDYFYYVFLTGFLYAVSRSNFIALILVLFSPRSGLQNRKLSILLAVLIAMLLLNLSRHIRSENKRYPIMDIPLLRDIINNLIERGYLRRVKNKQQILEDVLSEMIEKEDGVLRDLLKMILEIIKHHQEVNKAFDVILRY